MYSSPTVAVAGASGRLGKHVIKSLQTPKFKHKFGNVVALVRDTTPQDIIDAWKSQGVTVRIYNEKNMADSLKGIDVLINALSSKGHHFKDAISQALPSSSVKLYFPSEFGVDHSVHDFKQAFWDAKKGHSEEVKKIAPEIKVSRVYVGLFTEDSISPWCGFDTKEKRFECVGSPDTKISFTTREDSGKVMAALAALSPNNVPEEIHIAGDTASFREIAAVIENVGGGPISVTQLDMMEFKDKLMKEPTTSPGPYLRFIMGEDKLNHSKLGLGCDNELVNPGESEWKWTTLADLQK